MQVVVNGIFCELEKPITKEQEKLVKEMLDNCFVFTYYAPEDPKKVPIETVSVKLKKK